jgi:hypothetical protein
MRPAAPAAVPLAALIACAGGYSSGTFHPDDGGGIPPGGGSVGDAGYDAGHDGGSDAGADGGPDAGCTALALSAGNAGIVDSCISPPTAVVGAGSVSVNTTACTVLINTGTATGQCTGAVAGAHDAFDGGCGGYNQCSSNSLPGNIYCVTGPMSSCTILVCDGGC